MSLPANDRKERSIRWRLDVIVLSFILGLAALVDSELVERFARAGVELVADWVIAAAESVRPITRTVPPRSATAVVMITEKDAPDVAEKWPLPLSAYTRFIQRASCLGAGAVFLDIGLPSRPQPATGDTDGQLPQAYRDEIANFRQTVQTWGECPSWSARERTDPPEMPVLIPEQYDPALQHMAPPADGLRYVSAFIEPDNIVYPIEAPATPQDEPRPTVACELSQIVIAQRNRSKEEAACPSAIEIRDTSMTPSEQADFSQPAFGATACLYRRGWWGVLNQAMAFGLAFPRHLMGRRDDWETCPPVLTIPWEAMFDPARSMQLRQVLKGRVLLVSASIPGVSDRSQTELHSDIPGVYLHALATEALTSAFGAAQPALWWQRLILLLLGSLTVTVLRYGIYRPAMGRSWFGIRRSTVTSVQIAEGSTEVSLTETSREVSEEGTTAGRAERTEQAEKAAKRQGRNVAAVVVVLGVAYSMLGWKLRVLGLDLLFFWICHTDDIWWLDPARIFLMLVEGLRARLDNGYYSVDAKMTGADR